jgi:hypothetical protein
MTDPEAALREALDAGDRLAAHVKAGHGGVECDCSGYRAEQDWERSRAALAATPSPDRYGRTPRLIEAHPDDGHDHWYACIRCGVDNGLNVAATPSPALDVERIAALTDGVGYIVRDEQGHAFDPAIVMRNAVIAALSESDR